MPTTDTDHLFLRRAIKLAMAGRGRVEPNPMVGCVLVKNGKVIGEGIHAEFGQPHAEPTALASCTESPEGATAYVTLEPCCHTNKKTPPCAPRLIQNKIARVVIGCLDPNPDVDGKGVKMLRDAGIVVDNAPPEINGEAKQLLASFIATTDFKRPYVTLKWAESSNRKVAGENGTRTQISGESANRAVHQLRANSDAILVSINTVLKDDPSLTARNVNRSRLSVRYVLDSHLRIPLTSKLVQQAKDLPLVLLFTQDGFIEAGPDKIKQLMSAGVELKSVPADDRGRISIPQLFNKGVFDNITHLMVEPGPTLAKSFFDAGASDRLWVIHSRHSIDAQSAPTSASIPTRLLKTAETTLGDDTLTEYLDQESDLFFANVPSADFVGVVTKPS